MSRMVTLVEILQPLMKALVLATDAFGVEPLELYVHAMNWKYKWEREDNARQ